MQCLITILCRAETTFPYTLSSGPFWEFLDWIAAAKSIDELWILNKATVVSINSNLERAAIDYRWVYYWNMNTKSSSTFMGLFSGKLGQKIMHMKQFQEYKKSFEIKFSKQTNAKLNLFPSDLSSFPLNNSIGSLKASLSQDYRYAFW